MKVKHKQEWRLEHVRLDPRTVLESEKDVEGPFTLPNVSLFNLKFQKVQTEEVDALDFQSTKTDLKQFKMFNLKALLLF